MSQKNGISFPNAFRAAISLVEALPLTSHHAGEEILEQYYAEPRAEIIHLLEHVHSYTEVLERLFTIDYDSRRSCLASKTYRPPNDYP